MTTHPTPETNSHSTSSHHAADESAHKPAPTGAQHAPTGAQHAPTGAQHAPTGAQTAPTGAQHAPTGVQTSPTGAQHIPIDHKAIAARAYQKYLDGGQQDGQEVENWLKAEQELKAEQKPQTTVANPAARRDAPPVAEVSAYVSRQ